MTQLNDKRGIDGQVFMYTETVVINFIRIYADIAVIVPGGHRLIIMNGLVLRIAKQVPLHIKALGYGIREGEESTLNRRSRSSLPR